ncbi:hypothetical protein [Streptomyces sp. NPDC088736]|uniref:hypothetical protein n=1 Tax=Streptomyces sp. NPDC088736 TaxID=3365881 RepID=UPI003819E0DD
MTRAERLAILGPETVAAIKARVALAPEPPEELVEELRRIIFSPARELPAPQPATDSEPGTR